MKGHELYRCSHQSFFLPWHLASIWCIDNRRGECLILGTDICTTSHHLYTMYTTIYIHISSYTIIGTMFFILLRYIWHISLCKFKIYSIIIWFTYIVEGTILLFEHSDDFEYLVITNDAIMTNRMHKYFHWLVCTYILSKSINNLWTLESTINILIPENIYKTKRQLQ